MDDFLEQVARRKHQALYTVLYYIMWMFLFLFGFYALLCLMQIIGANEDGGISFSLLALIQTLIFGGLAFLLWRRADYCRVEYDYTFTNGTLDVSQVLNNKRRRYLTALEMN